MLTFRRLAVLAAFAAVATEGFQPVSLANNAQRHIATLTDSRTTGIFMSAVDDDENVSHPSSLNKTSKFKTLRQSLRKKAVAAVLVGAATGGIWNVATPQRAEASAPVMAVPKAEQRDPGTDAMLNHDRKMAAKQQAEIQEMNQKARDIEAKEGIKARIKFEKEYKAQKEQEAKERKEGLVNLKRTLLLKQGIHPKIDLEGERQVVLYEKGIDLGKVPGTMMYLEKQFEASSPKKSNAFKTEQNRRVIKAMAQDMENKGMDCLEYFEAREEKAQGILNMPPLAAAQLVAKYEANLEQYGQIDVPKEGEKSVKEKMAKSGGNTAAAKAAKAEAKAKAKAEKAAAKEAAKKEKAAAKAAKAAAAAAAATAAAAAQSAATAAGSVTDAAQAPPSTGGDSAAIVGEATSESSESPAVASDSAGSDADGAVPKSKKSGPSIPLVGVSVVAVGGGGFAFKVMQDKAAKDEEERKRQFSLLMGESSGSDSSSSSTGSAPALEVVANDEVDLGDAPTSTPPPASEVPVAPKKKRRGFFAKKNKNGRPTNLNVFITYEKAVAPEFASLLAKTLTYGAPGRFPSVAALPGDLPYTDFDLETAKKELIAAREDAGISLEESAEIFAGVVNCMLIDIVDLASSTLKSKEEKVTVDGISVVVDFMNHAASLYDSVAEGITITPVTYGGDLSKGQLEKMYSAYAGSGMMNMGMDADFDSRVGLLQDVFEIPPKKAEGIAMKAMQKSVMKMMKDGDGMEGMLEQFGGAEGLEGLADLAGGMGGAEGMNPEAMDPEQLKTMLLGLKEMKESGAIDPSEFEVVKEQFKEAYGGSIEDVIKEGDSNSEMFGDNDKELLELMKSLLYD